MQVIAHFCTMYKFQTRFWHAFPHAHRVSSFTLMVLSINVWPYVPPMPSMYKLTWRIVEALAQRGSSSTMLPFQMLSACLAATSRWRRWPIRALITTTSVRPHVRPFTVLRTTICTTISRVTTGVRSLTGRFSSYSARTCWARSKLLPRRTANSTHRTVTPSLIAWTRAHYRSFRGSCVCISAINTS